ncbi:MAG: ATP-binding protein [Thermodesulfobacteriota bacterium]
MAGNNNSNTSQPASSFSDDEKKFHILFESVNDGIFILDTDGNFLDVNRTAYDRLGFTKEEMLAKHVSELVPPEFAATVPERIARIKKYGEAVFESAHFRKDGTVMPVEVSAKIIDFPDQQVMLSVIRDISRRKRIENDLKQTSEKIKLFAFSIAHDLKTPAVALHGLAKLLSGKYGDTLNEKGRSFCDHIMGASEQIVALVDKINTYITTRENPLNIEYVSPREILQLIHDEFSTRLGVSNVAWEEPENLPKKIAADRISIIRVMRNLIDNSLKYGGENLTRIEIGFKETYDHYIFSVANDGRVLNKEDLQKIFGVFERKEYSKETSGTGLGLAIVKEIVEQHHGESWVESRKGEGMTFFFSISRNL